MAATHAFEAHGENDAWRIARRDIRSTKQSNMSMELGMLGLCLLAGAAGVYFEDVTVLCTVFFGGMATWGVFCIPSWIEATRAAARERAEASKEQGQAKDAPADAKRAAAVTPAAAAGAALPSPAAVMALIKARRSISIKDYNGAKVPREHVEMLLEAANWAPTHNLTQPWRFVVLEGEAKKRFEALSLECVGRYTPADKVADAVERMKGKMTKTWPLVSHYIVVCMARTATKSGKHNPEWEDLSSVACAVQNMHLLATALGIASYWTSWQAPARDAPEMAAFLGLDTAAGDKCYGVFPLGLSDRMAGYRGTRGPAMEKVTWSS